MPTLETEIIIDAPRSEVWKRLIDKAPARGSHFFILEPLDGGTRTRFRHGESFSGLLAPLVVRLLKAERGGPSYQGFNEDLRRRILAG